MLITVNLLHYLACTRVIARDDALGKIVHRFAHKGEFLLVQIYVAQGLSGCKPFVFAVSLAVGEKLQHLAAVEHANDIELLIGIAQTFLHLRVAFPHCLLQWFLQLVFVVFIPEIIERSPFVVQSEQLLRFFVLDFYHLYRFPVGYVEHPSAEHLRSGESVPRGLSAEFGDEVHGNCVYRRDAAVVEHADSSESISHMAVDVYPLLRL